MIHNNGTKFLHVHCVKCGYKINERKETAQVIWTSTKTALHFCTECYGKIGDELLKNQAEPIEKNKII